MAMIGYLVTVFYVSPYIEGVAAPITGAIVFALFAVVCLRWAFAIATSFMFGFTLVYMLSCAFPTVEILNLQSNVIALAIAGGAALIMLIVQLLVTRGQGSGEVAVVKRVRGNVRRKEIITEY